MKAQINLETKNRLFYQYVNTGVQFILDGKERPVGLSGKTAWYYGDSDRSTLLLKPLSSITDEDAIEVAKINGENYRRSIEHAISLDVALPDKTERDLLIRMGRYYASNPHKANIQSGDYLRLLGYCITWMGVEPDEQVAAGWVKLI